MRAGLAIVAASALLAACAPADRGPAVLAAAHCGACHQIPGIRGADGKVGPSLAGVGRRTTLAGVLPNRPDNLTAWIRTPQAIKPGDAMPDSKLSEQDARDAAAWLEAR